MGEISQVHSGPKMTRPFRRLRLYVAVVAVEAYKVPGFEVVSSCRPATFRLTGKACQSEVLPVFWSTSEKIETRCPFCILVFLSVSSLFTSVSLF